MKWIFFPVLTLFLSLSLSSCSSFFHKGWSKQDESHKVCKKCKRCKEAHKKCKLCKKCEKKKQKEKSTPQ